MAPPSSSSVPFKLLFSFQIISCIYSTLSFNMTWDKENTIKMPLAISSQLVCHLNDTVYFIGGRKTENNTLTSIDTVYMLNTSNNTFEKIGTIPGNAYFASNYICHNDSIYMFGPATDDKSNNSSGAGHVWIFNTVNHKTQRIPFPGNTDPVSLPCAVKNPMYKTVYIIGGKTSDGPASISDQTLLFNYTSNSFINMTLPRMPTKLYASMGHFINNTKINGTAGSKNAIIYIIGGEPSNKDILQYNTTSNKWLTIGGNATLNEARSFTRTIYFEDSRENFIFIVGGGSPSSSTNSFLNSTDIFYIGNYSVEPAFGDNLTYQVQYNTISKYEDKIFVWGFYAKVNGTNDTYDNIKKIFTFKLPNDRKKVSTWVTIGIISGTCGFMLLCGCLSYIACAKSKKVEQNEINYKRYSK